jgi:hypothetical protein
MHRALEQVFLRRRSGRYEALLVIERESGLRERVVVPLAEGQPEAAVTSLGRHLARSGSVDDVSETRLRVEAGGSLRDEPGLARRLAEAYAAERRRGGGAD